MAATLPRSAQAVRRAIAVFTSQAAMASCLGIRQSTVSEMANGLRPVPAERCPDIERETRARGCAVTCEELRPDVAWDVLRLQAKPAKTIAGDMDMSPSTLSRKLAPSPGDTQRFNVDDLEDYIRVTGDTSAVEYLVAKYMQSDATRSARAIQRVEALLAELPAALAQLKAAA